MRTKKSLGSQLRQLRKEQGISLAAFADSVGVSRPTVWAWETGKSRPRPKNVEALAHALGVAENELILTENEAHLKAAKRLDEENREQQKKNC